MNWNSCVFLLTCLVVLGGAQRRFSVHEEYIEPRTTQGDVGEPLYLTPYVEVGDVATARSLSQVTEPLDGLGSLQPLSYSGFITVDEETDSHIFFWFFPASEVDPSLAPVVMWLNGGPGSSSMRGLFEINGPISAVEDGDGGVTGEVNPHSWHRVANMIYIDQPVGAGFSHTNNNGYVTDQDGVARDLYETLSQFFQIFPEFLTNEFYAFGESYAGKYVPTISKKIHDENQDGAEQVINLVGLGMGNPTIDPYTATIYAEYMYQVGMIDEIDREEFLQLEDQFKEYVEQEDWLSAQLTYDEEYLRMLSRMGCTYSYDFTQCHTDPAENDFADYLNLDSSRVAAHVGDLRFSPTNEIVYLELYQDIPQSVKGKLEALLEEGYRVLIYSGNVDIICHHTGNVKTIQSLHWSGIEDYLATENQVYYVGDETAGYVTTSDNLSVFVMRNAGHMVPRSQPSFAFEMFSDFLDDNL